MGVISVPASATIYDRILRRIQKQLANRVYRFGEGKPAVEILVQDSKGLAALG